MRHADFNSVGPSIPPTISLSNRQTMAMLPQAQFPREKCRKRLNAPARYDAPLSNPTTAIHADMPPTETIRFTVFVVMIACGVVFNLSVFFAVRLVRTHKTSIWERFGGDLHPEASDRGSRFNTYKFIRWLKRGGAKEVSADLPIFGKLWGLFRIAEVLTALLAGVLMVWVIVEMWSTGMIGGWRFR